MSSYLPTIAISEPWVGGGGTLLVSLSLLLVVIHHQCAGYMLDNNPYRHFEVLDDEGKYELEWLVDWEKERVIFNISVRTKGYVGFGLSRKGKMQGADIVIGGVDTEGKPYFSDRYAIGNHIPKEDDSQDWELHSATESLGYTKLIFSRPFDSCDDDHDIPISGDLTSLIWAYGEVDDRIQYHFQNRGQFEAYLLDPDLTPREINSEYRRRNPAALTKTKTKVWTIRGEQTIPQKHTAYICSLHKSVVSEKNHMIGFQTILKTDLDRKHIHHYSLLRCTPPKGQSAMSIFQRDFEEGRKQECYILTQLSGPMRTDYCRESVYVWEPNGKPIFTPAHIGLPLEPETFFALQMHFDNPEVLPELNVTYELEIFYTDQLRKHDGGVIQLGGLTPGSPSLLIPPSTIDHIAFGHCSAGCLEEMLPPEGINFFAVNLHTHLAGAGLRLLHVRNGNELPWIAYDDNYNFDFQQIRTLREERTILPGDQLILRCTYTNTDTNGSVTTGGFATRDEMCLSFIFYYPRLPNHAICRSEIRSETYRNFIGVHNVSWSDEEVQNIITAPQPNSGLTVKEYGNQMEWTIGKRRKIQEHHRYLPQISTCPLNDPTIEEEGAKSSSKNSLSGPSFLSLQQLQKEAAERSLTKEDREAIREAQSEVQEPGTEFVSIYPRDIVPYQKPRKCGSNSS